MTEHVPTVGRIVHYVSYGTPGGEYTSTCRAAIVTEVHREDVASLAVLNPTGAFFNQRVEQGDPQPRALGRHLALAGARLMPAPDTPQQMTPEMVAALARLANDVIVLPVGAPAPHIRDVTWDQPERVEQPR